MWWNYCTGRTEVCAESLNRRPVAGGAAAEARRAFGSMAAAAAARDSLDDIRDEDDSRSDSDFSDRQIYGRRLLIIVITYSSQFCPYL